MASPVKNPCLNRGERMECESAIPPDDSDETDTDEENGGILSTYSGAGLIYFEHSYTKNCVSLCEMYDNAEFETEKLPVISENLNIQVPVRRSQRQINKSEKDVSSVNVVETTNIVQSPVKSKISIEEKSKENVDLSETITTKKNFAETKAVHRKKILKIEIKPIITDISVTSAKPLQKEDVSLHLSPSKVIKKAKISEFKALFEKEHDLDLKHKTNKKDESSSGENVEIKKKEDFNSTNVEYRRKRAYSEPSKNEPFSPPKEVEKDLAKSKRQRTMTKTKSPPEKAKRLEKATAESSMKKRKRNISAPSDKVESFKNDTKIPDSPNKGRRKKCTSLSESIPALIEPAKVEVKKRLSVENKGPIPKGPLTPSTLVKPKFKKTSRRESLRLVINEDEPPLFSQPDMMVKVKSDDVATKKEEKVETDDKNLIQSNEVSINKTEHPSSESNSVAEVESESPKILVKNSDSEVKAKEEMPQTNLETTSDVLDYFDEKDDIKDIDSENSLHIDEGVGKMVEEEYDECSKNNLIENMVNTSATSEMDKDILHKSIKEDHDNEMSNVTMSPSVQSNVDPDSDKPIAERKPRRIIKKKEFFEDITSRTATQTRKSGGKQKGTDKKSSGEEDSKQKRKRATKDEADSDESSEDDPSKLWCICRQPHNDRFMIQCDGCEDWFHGNCVGVTRQQGRKLEKQQKEWKCPNCLTKESEGLKTENVIVKKIEEQKVIAAEKKDVKEEKISNCNSVPKKDKVMEKTVKIPAKSPIEKPVPTSTASKSDTMPAAPIPLIKKSFNKNAAIRNNTKGNDASLINKKGMKEPIRRKQNCIVCHAVAASANSCYCSEKCLEKHVANSLAIMGEGKGALKGSDFDAQKVVVLDRVKGSVIAGDNAPTAGNILSWIKANPSFMIACSPSSSSSLRKETVGQRKEDSASASKEKKETSEESSNANVRFNVRKTLKNILMDRCKNADDIQLPEEEIRKIAVKIEEELHSLFKDNSLKYKSKYRSLMFNIKDPRNQGLFRKILKGNIPPDKLVRMSPEELASMELAKWREQENQHLLDMIKRVQLEQQSGSGLLLKKTHKGEVEIEDDFTNIIDDIPKTSSKTFSGEPVEVEKPEPDKEVVVKDTTHHHRSHLFDLNCKICTGKILPPPVEDNAQKKVRVAHSISVDLSSPAALDPVEKTISRIVDGKSPLSSTGDDSLDQEPTSTVSIGSPETPVKYTYDSDPSSKVASSVWKGFIFMQDVAKFVTSAYKVSGQTEYLHMDVPDTIQVCGRIIPDQVWEYLGKIKQSGNKELIIVRFQAANQEEAATYNSFYSYLSTRKRYGVVSNYSKKVKDFYILPLAATSPVPIVLMPFDGPGLPSPRPHLLLGVIVRHKIKQAGIPISKKEKGKEDYEKLDGSFTPPLDTRSYTPPLPALQTDISPDTAYSPSIDFKSTISSEESDITQNSIASCTDIPSKNDSDIYEPSYTPPLQILSSDSPKDRDDDKPYDPEQDILNIESEARDSKLSPRENIDKYVASENLEKHKKILDALTRQVEETDRQVNALKQMISHPDDSDAEFHSPSNQSLDINSVTASGMSSFLDLPENLQDLLNVVRDKTKVPSNREDVDMRISNLFGKSFSTSVDKFSSFQGLSECEKTSSPQEKNLSRGATPPVDDTEEVSPAVVRPSDPRIKLRTSFQDPSFSSEEPANVSLSNMSVTELVERAEKELADIDAVEKAQNNSQSGSNQEKVVTTSIDKMSSSWSQFKEPPPPGIELPDLTSQESSFSSKSVSSSSTSDNSLPSSFTSPLVQDSPLIVPPFPPPALPSTFPTLPPGFSVQTPPPNIKNFPPPNVISTSFPPPPIPIASKSSDGNPVSETWPSWNIPPQQSKDNGWQNRVPQWDENWKNAHDTAPVESSESSSHYYPPASHEFHKEQFFRAESSSESRWSRSSPRFGRNNWNKRPNQGGRWRGRRAFHYNKNQRN